MGCDNTVAGKKCSENYDEDRVCTEQNGGTSSCKSKFNNRPIGLLSTGCSGEPAAGPAEAVRCADQNCVNVDRGVKCFCAGTGSNKCNGEQMFTYPTSCGPKPPPGSGAEGKVGSVLSVLVATIFAAVIYNSLRSAVQFLI